MAVQVDCPWRRYSATSEAVLKTSEASPPPVVLDVSPTKIGRLTEVSPAESFLLMVLPYLYLLGSSGYNSLMKNIEIPIFPGPKAFAIIDEVDRELVMKYRWNLHGAGYAVGQGGKLLMHRLVLGAEKGRQIDHVNGNKLDNRRENLRYCTVRENSRNMHARRMNSTSRFKGVFRFRMLWSVVIVFDGRQHFVGALADEEAAARIYDGLAREYFREFAQTNFPGDERLTVAEAKIKVRAIEGRTRYHGVSYSRARKGWRARIVIGRRQEICIGVYRTEEEAAVARDRKVKELGLIRPLNFPE